jgi:oxygen-independent coproporphyrinogen-3 oxidase
MTIEVNQPIQSAMLRSDPGSDQAIQPDLHYGNPTGRTDRNLAVYVHIPFCDYHCSFCDFAVVVGQKARVPDYIDAVNAELSLRLSGRPKPIVNTVFFGGGTPGSIEPSHIAAVLDALRRSCNVVPDAEITLEANPGNHDPAFWPALRQAGINRVSIGIQTLDDRILSEVGRRHSADDAIAALRAVHQAGFSSLSADLMFGLPGQTPAGWKDTLDRVLAEPIDHLSVYGLIIEPGTPMERGIRRGSIHPPTDDDAADMYEYAIDALAEAGFEHYEISNWGKPGLRSRHNMTYWRHDPYLGLGMGAHSYYDGLRSANLRGLTRYVQTVKKGELPIAESDRISPEQARADAAMLGLRLVQGIHLPTFNERFGGNLVADHAEAVDRFAGLGLLEIVNHHLRLTRSGYLVANQIWQEFI